MSLLTLYGAGAVSLMLIAYTLERRAPAWVLLFAGACAASRATWARVSRTSRLPSRPSTARALPK